MRKRLLLALLTVVLVFGLVASASAATFSDVADSVAQGDIQKLNALGIIDGYPDGTFKPDGDITRAEFAKIAVVMAGLEDSAAFLQNSASQFGDVAAGQWYTGWVNVAASQGIIKGYPDGTFQPQANISGAEAVTILVRLLGYDDRLPGTWPVNYMAKAGELGITKDVAFNASINATRGVVCQLASATLDQELVNYSKDIEDFKFKLDADDEKITLLAQKFDSVLIKKHLVVEVRLESDKYVADLYKPADKNKTEDLKPGVVFDENVVVSGALNVFGLEGSFIDYIVNDDDEIVSATSKNYKKVFGEVDTPYDGKKIEVNDTKYTVEEYCVEHNFVYVDGCEVTKHSAKKLENLGEAYGKYATLFFNKDNKVAYITCSGTPGDVVKKIDADKGRIEFKSPNYASTVRIDTDDDDYLVMRNGAIVDLDDLQINDIVYVQDGSKVDNARGFDYIIKAVYNPVSGDYTKWKSNKAHIDGVGYKTTIDSEKLRVEDRYGDEVKGSDLLEKITDLLGDEVTAHLNANGLIRYITGTKAESDKIVAVVKNGGKTDYRGDIYWVEVVTDKGDTVSYDIEEDYGKKNFEDTDVKVRDVVNSLKVTYPGSSGTPELRLGDLVEIGLNSDGEVDNIVKYDGDVGIADYSTDEIGDLEKDYDRLKVSNVWKYYENDTVIFDLQFDDTDKTIDPELATWKDIKDAKNFVATVYHDGSDMEYIIVTSDKGITKASNNGVYAGWSKDSDGTWVELYADGEFVKYKTGNGHKYTEGVIYQYELSSDNKITVGSVSGSVYCGYVPYKGIYSGSKIITVGAYVYDGVKGTDEYMGKLDASKEFKVTKDTMIVDIDNDEIVEFADIGEEDFVVVLQDEDGVAEIVVIIQEDDIGDVKGKVTQCLDQLTALP